MGQSGVSRIHVRTDAGIVSIYQRQVAVSGRPVYTPTLKVKQNGKSKRRLGGKILDEAGWEQIGKYVIGTVKPKVGAK